MIGSPEPRGHHVVRFLRTLARSHRRFVFAAVLLAASCTSMRSHGVRACGSPPRNGVTASSCGAESQQSPTKLDMAEETVTRGLRKAAAWIDSLLSDERSREELNRSWASIRLDTSAQEREGFDLALRVDMRLVLPQTEDRLHLLVGGDSDPNGVPAVSPGPDFPAGATEIEPRDPDVAVQLLLKRTRSNDIRPEVGARFHEFEPDPYAGVRWRHMATLGAWLARVTERCRAYVDAGLESRTTVDFEHGVFERLLFRSSTRMTWRAEEPGYSYGQRFTFFDAPDSRTVIAYEWDTSFVTEPDDAVAEMVVRWRYSRRFAKNRLLLEIAPQVAWREEVGHEPAAGMLLGIELDFGRDD